MAPEASIAILNRANGGSIAYSRREGRPDRPGIVFFGGFRSDMSGSKAMALDRFAAERGLSCLRFDYRGHGRSSGRFEDGTIGNWLEDSLAVVDRLSVGPQVFVGSSMGAWLALLAAEQRTSRVAGLVAIAPAVDFTEALIWARLDKDQRERLMAEGLILAHSEYDPAGYPITRDLIVEGRQHLMLDRPIPLEVPVRILHGLEDATVPWQHSMRLVEALASRDATLTLVKGGDHRLSTPADLTRLEHAVGDLVQCEAVRHAAP